ncbi:MAG: MFS transporter [Desulfobacteraceae bacterium]|nr:MFS transporter [Desulfobacteraceae bacterium]
MRFFLNRNIAILLGGQFVSQMGDKFYILALAYWVLETTQSSAQMGIMLFYSFFPAILLGIFAGAYIDRYDRKKIIVLTDLIRGAVVFGVLIFYLQGALTLPIIIAAQVLLSICAAFYDPSIPAVIPQIVNKDQLVKANSLTQFVQGFSTIAGPVLGGIAIATVGYKFIFVFNALSYIISGIFECFIAIPKREIEKSTESSSIFKDLGEGFRFIAGKKPLLVILSIVGIIHFFVGSIEVVVPVIASRLTGAGPTNLGFLQTSIGVGTVLVAIIVAATGYLNNKEEKFLFGAVSFIGVNFVLVGTIKFFNISTVYAYMAFFCLIGGSIVVAATCFRTILQKFISNDNDMAGRLFGVVGVIGNFSIPLAMLVYGFVMEYVNLALVIGISGALLTITTAIFIKLYFGAWQRFLPYGAIESLTRLNIYINR